MIVFTHADFWIVDKPAGMPSQDDKSGAQSVAGILGGHLINRLDRGVGGLMLVAKNSEAAGRLAKIDIGKTYTAVVMGQTPEAGELEDYLVKNQRLNTTRVTDKNEPGAKLAKLIYRQLNFADGLSLLEIELLTGRHHQIRAQLAHAGHPIWGDRKYAPRQYWAGDIALRSYKLHFEYQNTEYNFAGDVGGYPFDLL